MCGRHYVAIAKSERRFLSVFHRMPHNSGRAINSGGSAISAGNTNRRDLTAPLPTLRRGRARARRSELIGMQSFVVGATGIVGGYIVEHLVKSGETPLALSRASTAVRSSVAPGRSRHARNLEAAFVRDLVLHGGGRPAGGCAAAHLHDGPEARRRLHLHQHRHQDRISKSRRSASCCSGLRRGRGG